MATPQEDIPPFFAVEGEDLVPAPFARGPWGQTLHGRLLGGLTAREVEGFRVDDPDLGCTRLTIDLFRSAAMAPLQVSRHLVRDGRRIKVLDVTFEQDGDLIGQGRAVLLRRGEQPPGPFRDAPQWEVPPPVDERPPVRPGMGDRFTAMWDTWRVNDDQSVSAGAWIRDFHDLIRGEPLTPLIRVALAGDMASPMTNSGPDGLAFINADFTIYMGREPRGELIGMQPFAQVSGDGLAAGQCLVHDVHGPFGFVATTAIANSMSRSNAARPPTA